MPRFPSLLLALLLFSAAAFAQTADLRVSIEAPESVVPGQTFTFRGTIHNDGPDDAEEVTFHLVSFMHQPYCYDTTRIGRLAAGASRTFACTVTAKTPPYFIRTSMTALSPQDRKTENNAATRDIPIITPPDLLLHPPPPVLATPGLPFDFTVAYVNLASVEASSATLNIEAPAAILTAPEGCTIDGIRATCALGTIAPRSAYATLAFTILAPDVSEHAFAIEVAIASSGPDHDPTNNSGVSAGRTYRTFFVTNEGDAGSGSLREAIEGANASCKEDYPCLIAFRIPRAGSEQWHTIRIESPLPRVVAEQLLIEGTTQARYFGDWNPLGPEIEVTGSANAGNAFEMAVPCRTSITGLAINAFPAAAIWATPSRPCPGNWGRIISDNYIGTDPTGRRAVANERGIVVDVPDGNYPWRITNNVISGNRRSAIFVGSGRAMLIENNILGLNAALTEGLGNGASGIYLSPAAPYSEIKNNYIGFNAHFGLAIARGTADVVITGNSFQANHQHGIDRGLDGVPTDDQSAIPEITAVRFEDGATIVEGRVTRRGNFGAQVAVYANDAPDPSGFGEGQYYLGTAFTYGDVFTFRHPHDLRGKWVTATSTDISIFGFLTIGEPRPDNHERHAATSEFSRAVEVR